MSRGSRIPDVEYSPEEVQVWATVLSNLHDLLPQYACKEYLNCYPLFNFRPDRVRTAATVMYCP